MMKKVLVLGLAFHTSFALATKGGYEEVLADYNKIKPKVEKLHADIKKLNADLAPMKRKVDAEIKRHNKLKGIKKTLDGPRHIGVLSYWTARIAPKQKVLEVKSVIYTQKRKKMDRLFAKCEELACWEDKKGLYVIAISGGGGGYIEEALNLRELLEGKDAHLRLANWNNIEKGTADVVGEFPTKDAFDRFQDKVKVAFQRMPAKSKLIIVGHSLGGGAAAKMVDTAKKIDRQIDELIVLDPVGELGVRVNATHLRPVTGPCPPPKFFDDKGNEKGSDALYNACKAAAFKRKIPKEVKNFFNRWQAKEMWPIDYKTSGSFKVHKDVRSNQSGVNKGHGEILHDYADYVRRVVSRYL